MTVCLHLDAHPLEAPRPCPCRPNCTCRGATCPMPTHVKPVLLIGSRGVSARLPTVAWYNAAVLRVTGGLPAVVITGGAMGGDYLGAMFAVQHDLPLEVFLPYALTQAPATVKRLIAGYSRVQLVEGDHRGSFAQAAHRRNRAMVERLVALGGAPVIAVTEGTMTPGTRYTLDYAAERGLKTHTIVAPTEEP